MKPDAFIAMLAAPAQACQRATGIPASFTVAQAALESGWGERAPGCNLFGVKADPSWKGAVTLFNTHEVVKGVRVPIVDRFRCYASWGECLADRAAFFKANKRYAACFRETTGEGWARAVAAAGYATDPDYAAKLVAVIRSHTLSTFDKDPDHATSK